MAESRSGSKAAATDARSQAKALREAGRRLVVLADHTKWGVVGLCQIAGLAEIDTWVVDETPEAAVHELGERAPDLADLVADDAGGDEADAGG